MKMGRDAERGERKISPDRGIGILLQPAVMIAATDPTGDALFCCPVWQVPRPFFFFAGPLFAQASGGAIPSTVPHSGAGAEESQRSRDPRGDSKGTRDVYPETDRGGCCVRSQARRKTSQCSRQGVDNGRPTLREQRDGVWGISRTHAAKRAKWMVTRGEKRVQGRHGGEYATKPCESPASDDRRNQKNGGLARSVFFAFLLCARRRGEMSVAFWMLAAILLMLACQSGKSRKSGLRGEYRPEKKSDNGTAPWSNAGLKSHAEKKYGCLLKMSYVLGTQVRYQCGGTAGVKT